MIGIVTLNPCVDKTMFFDTLPDEGVTITKKTFTQAGGKGVNVARVLKALGVECRLFTMIGGETGQMIRRLLKEETLSADYVSVTGDSRMYLTLLDDENRQIALKEQGPVLSEEQADMVKAKFLIFLETVDFLCLCDTIPCPALVGFYPWAIEQAKKREIPVFLDMDGEALRLGLAAGPTMIKPNMEEYAALLEERPEEVDVVKAMCTLKDMGIKHPVISLGGDGAITCDKTGIVRFYATGVHPVSAVGCGDSFIAGLVWGYTRNLSWTECMQWATAAGAANCEKWEAARLTYDEIATKLEHVHTEYQ